MLIESNFTWHMRMVRMCSMTPFEYNHMQYDPLRNKWNQINDAITLVAWFKMTSVVTGSANLGGDAASRTALVGKYLVRLCPWSQMARIQWSFSFKNTPWTRLVQEYCKQMWACLSLNFFIVLNFGRRSYGRNPRIHWDSSRMASRTSRLRGPISLKIF